MRKSSRRKTSTSTSTTRTLEVDALEDDDDDIADVVDVDEEDDAEVDEVDEILTPSPAAVVEKSGDGDDEEEEEEPDDEDVEASLDVILKERLVVEDEPEDEEATDQEDKTEGNERVLPKQPDEFVCRSCFLVKHPSQLADAEEDALPGLCLRTVTPMAGSRTRTRSAVASMCVSRLPSASPCR